MLLEVKSNYVCSYLNPGMYYTIFIKAELVTFERLLIDQGMVMSYGAMQICQRQF